MTHQDFRSWIMDEQEKEQQEEYDREQKSKTEKTPNISSHKYDYTFNHLNKSDDENSENQNPMSLGNILEKVMKDIHERQKAQAKDFAEKNKSNLERR